MESGASRGKFSMEITGRKVVKVQGRAPPKGGKPAGLQTAPSRKVSARMPKGKPEVAAVTGSNGKPGVGKQSDVNTKPMQTSQP